MRSCTARRKQHMEDIQTGGPAFPSGLTEMADDTVDSLHKGMTLRDYVAAKAMSELLAAKRGYFNNLDERFERAANAYVEDHIENDRKRVFCNISVDAYAMADAMLKARAA